MKLGETTQLQVYANAMKNCSDAGNREAVEMFGKMIREIASKRKERAFLGLEAIMFKDNPSNRDRSNALTFKNNVEIYDEWLKNYSLDSVKYKERLSQAEVNSWKQGGDGASCP
jgi:hypothetical protein